MSRMQTTAHVDTFARDNLPPRDAWPELLFEIPELQYPARMNCGVELLDRAVERGWGDRTEGPIQRVEDPERSTRPSQNIRARSEASR